MQIVFSNSFQTTKFKIIKPVVKLSDREKTDVPDAYVGWML
jgi:hypothetical protein